MQIIERLVAELGLDSGMRNEEHLCLLVETLVQVIGLLVLLDVPFEEIHLQTHVPILASLVLAFPLLPLLQLADVGDVDVESLCQLDDWPRHLATNQLDIHNTDDDVAEVSEYEVRKPERKDVQVQHHFKDNHVAPQSDLWEEDEVVVWFIRVDIIQVQAFVDEEHTIDLILVFSTFENFLI